MYNIGVVSLGCPKNRVDTENMLGILGENGYAVVNDPEDADIIIVNTCAFIDDAKTESVETVLEMAKLKEKRLKLLIMTGCLAERYHDEILQELPEVDAVLGTGDYDQIAAVISRALEGEKPVLAGHPDREIPENLPRMLSTGNTTAYLKIADGCDNHCTYCIIPKLRGKYKSRPMEDVLAEAETLCGQGVRELIVIAQDTTRYGYDLYGKEMLGELLRQLCKIPQLHWLRVHYMYPESITDDMIATIKNEPKIVKYMDIPIQHANDRILKLMGRKTDKMQITHILEKLRSEIPDLCIRTSLIAGFPTETEEESTELYDFVKTHAFDRLGVFAYSQEEDTAAAKLEGQIPQEIKEERRDRIMELQQTLSAARAEKLIGKELEVLTEGYDMDNLMYYGRSTWDSPEIDNRVYFAAEDEVEIGSFVHVLVLDADSYDITGKLQRRGEE